VQILTYSGALAPAKIPFGDTGLFAWWASGANDDPVFFPDILRVFDCATTPWGIEVSTPFIDAQYCLIWYPPPSTLA